MGWASVLSDPTERLHVSLMACMALTNRSPARVRQLRLVCATRMIGTCARLCVPPGRVSLVQSVGSCPRGAISRRKSKPVVQECAVCHGLLSSMSCSDCGGPLLALHGCPGGVSYRWCLGVCGNLGPVLSTKSCYAGRFKTVSKHYSRLI